MKATRNRKPKPPTSFTGLTAEQWRLDAARLEWAQHNSIFWDILAVLTNARNQTLKVVETTDTANTVVGISGDRAIGRVEGYEMAITTLRSLTQGIKRVPPPTEATYAPRDEDDYNLRTVHD